MEDPKVPFADTTARRAQLIAASERFKASITDGVDGIKEDAAEIGKTTLFVTGAALAVYLVADAILPKSDEYRYAEKYGEPDEFDDDFADGEEEQLTNRRLVKRSSAAKGLIGGLVTSILTNIAREQLIGFLSRIRSNNAINPTAKSTEYHEQAPSEPVDYTSSV